MWTVLLKRSIGKSLRTTLPRKEFILALNTDQDTLKRFFSSGSDDSKKIGFEELTSMLARKSNQNQDEKRGKQEKSNFDRDVLLPASRGQLNKKHSSGIPRLAGRKHKASLAPKEKEDRRRQSGSGTRFLVRGDDFDEETWDEENDMLDDEAPKMFQAMTSDDGTVVTRPVAADEDLSSFFSENEIEQFEYHSINLINDEKYFWREEEYDPYHREDEVLNHRAMEASGAAPERAEDDSKGGEEEEEIEQQQQEEEEEEHYENFDYEEDFLAADDDDIPPREIRTAGQRSKKSDGKVARGILDVIKWKAPPEEKEEIPSISLPLLDFAVSRDGLVSAMFRHPTKYAQFVSDHAHPQSQREPRPFFPKGRAQPSKEFLETHARFLFVTGLPPDVDGGDITDPLFRRSLQKQIAKLVGVESQSVFPANATSAFVGFDSPKALSRAIASGPREPTLKLSPKLSRYNDADYNDAAKAFVKDSPDSTLELVNIPPGHTAWSLIDNLILSDESTAKVYGDVTSNDIYFVSETRVLIRFRSKQQADAALESILWEQSLEQLGRYPIRYFRARRELVHVCFGGAGKSAEIRKVGPRLIVDSDMPSKQLYISHAGTLHLRNLDPYVTKEDISAAFQPFCSRPHIAETSVEFVTCENGIPTGEAYVGFDVAGDAESAIKALSGAIKLGDRRSNLRLLSDRPIPGRPQPPPEKRPERSVEELLDDLNNWEKYVDAEDIKILEAHGVSKIVLDEALRGIRWKNKTFGAFDGSIRAEALEPEKERGEQYKELVQMYVATLKECLATPDDVGAVYESLHFPDEPIDLSIFDREKERQEKLLQARNAPN